MNLLLTCFKIFFARILDVCISTVRTTFVLRGKTIIVAILAFCEVTIWFLVARTALNIELNLFIVLSYSGGYTTGTVIGTIITNKFIKTNIELMVISNKIRTVKKIKDNVLYLGIKQNLLFGFDNRNGGYSFVIKDDFKKYYFIANLSEIRGKVFSAKLLAKF